MGDENKGTSKGGQSGNGNPDGVPAGEGEGSSTWIVDAGRHDPKPNRR